MTGWLAKIINSVNGKSNETLCVWFEEILVGTLKKERNFYIFEYDNKCPDELKIKGLEGDGEIRFKYLPPFFTTRVPSKSRPELVEKFEEIGDDPLKILGELGSQSPVSPMYLK